MSFLEFAIDYQELLKNGYNKKFFKSEFAFDVNFALLLFLMTAIASILL